jgi:hypothetical protein
MEVLVFANPKDASKERFFVEISKVPKLSPKFVLERESFANILMENITDRKVLVFLAYDQEDLSLAISLKDYLIDTRVIMVLPDSQGETVRRGLSMGPSFITDSNGDFKDVIAVLEKISDDVATAFNPAEPKKISH